MLSTAVFIVGFAATKALRTRGHRAIEPAPEPRSALPPPRPIPQAQSQAQQGQELEAIPGMIGALSKHGMTVCSCGSILAYCACPSCLANGQQQTVVFKDACSICVQREVSAKLGPVLEVGADQVLISQGGRVLGVKAFSASVPLASLRAMIAMADAKGLSDNTQIGMLVRQANTLSIPKEIDITTYPDGASRLKRGSCALCGKGGLLDGEYCIACALEMREAHDES